ncbi:MAG: thiamine diphosphokinase [Alistipes sp.]|nr:thiamine diphosphokinase [Alistipes sp.]
MRSNIEAVVIANGEYPTRKEVLEIINSAPLTVCCDGAADDFIARGGVPDIIIGDMDSLSDENKARYSDIIIHNPDQETNDQTKAVQYLLSRGITRIAIVGATGRREDHTIANIALTAEYMAMGAEVVSYTDSGCFIPCRDNKRLQCTPNAQVSIFNINATALRSEGLDYPIYDFTALWQGTLNCCRSGEFTISAQGDYIVFITAV